MACDVWGCTAGYLCVRVDAGTAGSGPHWRECNDINECLTNNGGCQHTCSNNDGSYTCSCNTGYSLSGQYSCTDINECTSGSNGGCDHMCSNTVGSYRCSCNTGYYLSGQHSCLACDSIADCEVRECTGPGDSTCTRCRYDRGEDTMGYLLAADGKSCTHADGILNGSLTCQSYDDGSTSHVVSQDSPALSTHNCTRSHVIFVTPQHGDRLFFTAKSRNGGYVKIRNYDGSSGYTVDPSVYYSGQEVSRTAHFTFDFVPPYHCSVEGNCSDSMLDRGPAVTRNGTIRLRWSGWQDDASGIRSYTYEIVRLQPCGDGLGMPGQERECQQESASRPNQTAGLCALGLNGTQNGTNSTNNTVGQNGTGEGNITWGNCTVAEVNNTEPKLNGTGEENATTSAPQVNRRRIIREAGEAEANGNNTSNITVQGDNTNTTSGSNGTDTNGSRNSTGTDSAMDGRNVTNGGNVTDVEDGVVYPLNGSVGADNEQVDVTITEPGVYSVTLTVEDSTAPGEGNVITARRFLLFDDNSTVETDTSGNFPLLVTSAANDTGWLWQTNLQEDNNNDTKLTWSGHFFNKLHRDNNFLGAIVPHPNNISAEYEETYGQPPTTRSREAIPHVQGIVLFQTTWGVDHQGGRSLTLTPGNWENVTDVMAEGQDFEIPREDGNTVRFWVRAIDVMGDVAEDDVTIHVDSSPPVFENVTFSVNWTDKIDFLKVHIQARDLHSGLFDVHWKLQDTIRPLLIHGEGRMVFQTAEECEAPQCYCIPKDSDCFFWEYTIDIEVREMNLSVNLLADGGYNVTLTVTNNAMLRTTDTRQVIVDELPGADGITWLLIAGGLIVFGVLLIAVCLLVAKRVTKRKVVPTAVPIDQKYQPAPTPLLHPTENFCNPSKVILPFKEPAEMMTTVL
uniref:EGF-like domain-containing protein n=1 Tax=Branchiostoma floridae TaxID=7739 RepID=C3Y556_BRAFL|eukprot:XP_002608579.1 hypothetical protein BRAFLDRAFT_128816 [Branchiostoma floridae]